MCSTGEAGSYLSYVHMTYPDLLNFSMHEKNRTESIITQRGKYIHCISMHVCEILVQRWDRRLGVSLSSSFGGVWQTLLPMYLERRCLDGRVSHCLPVSTTRRDAMTQCCQLHNIQNPNTCNEQPKIITLSKPREILSTNCV